MARISAFTSQMGRSSRTEGTSIFYWACGRRLVSAAVQIDSMIYDLARARAVAERDAKVKINPRVGVCWYSILIALEYPGETDRNEMDEFTFSSVLCYLKR